MRHSAVSINEYKLALAFTPLTEALNSQFFRLWRALHNRNYVHFAIMESCAGFACQIRM